MVKIAGFRDYVNKTNKKFTSAGEKLLQFTLGAGKIFLEFWIAVSELI